MSRRKLEEPVEEIPPPPTKPDSFRKYLNDGGVLESLTRLIVGLYEKRPFPTDPNEFIKQFLASPHGLDYNSLVKENEELKEDVKKLEARVEELKVKLGIKE